MSETNTIQDSKYIKNTTGYKKIWNNFLLKEPNEEKIHVACMGNKMLIRYGESGLLKSVCATFRCRYKKKEQRQTTKKIEGRCEGSLGSQMNSRRQLT